MRGILNKIFGISQRCKGEVNKNGEVTITKILSYDLVGEPGFSDAILKDNEREELLKKRKEKLDKLNNL